eukprot:365125-Chlamydomonas_euryale.AAC.1
MLRHAVPQKVASSGARRESWRAELEPPHPNHCTTEQPPPRHCGRVLRPARPRLAAAARHRARQPTGASASHGASERGVPDAPSQVRRRCAGERTARPRGHLCTLAPSDCHGGLRRERGGGGRTGGNSRTFPPPLAARRSR